MLRKIFVFLISISIALLPVTSRAGDWGFFDSLLGKQGGASVNAPGYYQSGTRGVFSAGGLDVRIPSQTNNPMLLSVNMPSFEASCTGISAHFGGFSFISGEEFGALLSKIGAGVALGFVTQLAIKVVCPMCEDIINKLKEAAQIAARLAKDSCNIGRGLASKLGSKLSDSFPIGPDRTKEDCAKVATTKGDSTDWLKALTDSSSCGSMTKAYDSLMSDLMSDPANPTKEDKDKAIAALGVEGYGNVTWSRLEGLDASSIVPSTTDISYKRKLLIMNLMGVKLNYLPADAKAKVADSPKCSLVNGGVRAPTVDKTSVYCAPTLEPKEVIGYYMCGVPTSFNPSTGKPLYTGMDESVMSYCESFFAKDVSLNGPIQPQQIYVCKDAGQASMTCNEVITGSISAIVNQKGMLQTISELLEYGVNQVRTNQPLVSEADINNPNAIGNKLIKLMNIAPYPLYQAMNSAAVYPAAAGDLLKSMGILVAESIAVVEFDNMLKPAGRSGSDTAKYVSKEEAEKIIEFLSGMRAKAGQMRTNIGQNLAVQQAINEQIRMVNVAIQRQVLTQDMLTSNRYAQNIGTATSK